MSLLFRAVFHSSSNDGKYIYKLPFSRLLVTGLGKRRNLWVRGPNIYITIQIEPKTETFNGMHSAAL